MYHQYGYLGLGIDVPYTTATGATKVGHPAADGSGTCADPFAVQQMLKDLGYYNKAVDGQFGTGTFTALASFAQSHGVSYTTAYPKADLCQALMDAWQANQSAPVSPAPPPAPGPAPAPAPGTPSISTISPEVLQRFARLIRPGMLLPHPATATAPTRFSTPAPTGIKAWWSKASTTTKLAVVGGGVLALGALAYFLIPMAAVANPRRRRRVRQNIARTERRFGMGAR
jgi:hypothetical protein